MTVDTILTCTGDRQIIFVDSSSNPVILTLPDPSSLGCRFDVKDYGPDGFGYTSVNPVYLDPGTGNIDGEGGLFLLGPDDGASIRILGVGPDWVSGV